MKIYQLADNLLDKFVPMDDQTKTELRIKSSTEYLKLTKELEVIEQCNLEAEKFNKEHSLAIEEGNIKPHVVVKIPLKLMVIKLLESWYMRYLIAISFIFLVPKIKKIINGESDKVLEDDGEDDEFESYMQYKRFKKSML